MLSRYLQKCAVGLVLLVASACSPPSIAFEEAVPNYPRPMVAKKSSIPLFLVYDSSSLADSGATKDEYPVQFTGLTSFVNRDLKSALELYYSTVTVVSPGSEPKDGPALIALVRVDSLRYETNRATAGGTTAQISYPRMDWAVGLRAAGADEFILSFAATSTGNQGFASASDVEAAFHSLLGAAVSDFLASYTEKDVQTLVLGLESAGSEVPLAAP